MVVEMDEVSVVSLQDRFDGLIVNRLHQNACEMTAGSINYPEQSDAMFAGETHMAMINSALVGWILLVLYGTFSGTHPIVDCLSIRKSLNDLTFVRNSRLDFLDVIRVIAIVWVMINHTGSEGRLDILDRLPSAEVFKASIHEHPVFGPLLGNSALGVEIFLVLSGLLATYSWFRDAQQPFWSHYAKFLMKRWLRLFPSIAIFVYIASGPIMQLLLPRYHTSMISACGVSGIAAQLSFLSNWQETPTCMGYLWYLGLDMQLYIAAPFLLHMLYKCPRKALTSALLLITASALLRAVYCLGYGKCNNSDVDIPFIFYPDQDPSTISSIYAGLWEMYARPYTKCGPFLVGMVLGYYVLHSQTVISNTKSATILASGITLAILTIYGILPEYWNPHQGNTLYNTLYTALFRTVFAIAIAMIIAALVFRKERCHVPLMWSILARLTFNAYLLHMPIVFVFNHFTFLQTATTPYELVAVMPLVAALSFSTAFIFHIFVEAPFGRISNLAIKSIF